jgi:hypothetical protein
VFVTRWPLTSTSRFYTPDSGRRIAANLDDCRRQEPSQHLSRATNWAFEAFCGCRPSLSLRLPEVELITPHIGCCRSGRARQAASRRPETLSRFALFLPRRALHGAVRTIRSCDLARRAVPVLLMPAVGLPLSLPQRIGTLSDLLVLLPIHGHYPHTSSD